MPVSQISSDWLSQDNLSKIALVARYILVLWLLYVIGMFAWGYFQSDDQSQANPIKAVASTLSVRKTPAPNASSLVNFHLFGAAKEKESAPVQEAVPVDAPDTKLKLFLHGVLSIENSEKAQAIISDPAGKEDYYALGALLPGNATLESIYPDRVILKRLGRFETLRMPWESVAPKNGNARRSPARLPARANRRVLPAATAQGILQQIGATQHMQDGRAIGYKVMKPEGYVLASWGVKSNDVVTSINGVKLTGPDKIAAVMKSLVNTKAVKIELLRNNKPVTLNRAR